MAVLDDRQRVDEFCIKRADVGSHGFLPGHSGVRRGEMQAGYKREGSGAIMDCGGDVEGLGQLKDAARFADTAAPRGINHHIIRRLFL